MEVRIVKDLEEVKGQGRMTGLASQNQRTYYHMITTLSRKSWAIVPPTLVKMCAFLTRYNKDPCRDVAQGDHEGQVPKGDRGQPGGIERKMN